MAGIRPREHVSSCVEYLSNLVLARVGLVSVDPSTDTCSFPVYIGQAIGGAKALANPTAGVFIKGTITWKMYPKADQTGL